LTGPVYALESLLAVQLKASASAAAFQGVLRCMRMRFPAQTRLAEQHGNLQLAIDIYERAKAMPATVTSAQMAADGYRIGEPVFPGSDILIAYKECVVKLVKPLKSEEALRIREFLAVRGDLLNAHVVPFELLWGDPAKGKSFMVMPRLPALLEPMQPLSPAHACLLWEHMLSALEYLHGLGFAHCDIKPSNICVQEPVAFVLIDLGSIAAFGSSAASTAAYVPRDMKRGRSSPTLDWCMLGKKCCGDAALDLASGSQSITRAELLAHLQAHLPRSVWEALKGRV
jgi:serine/threonine protein kinase